MLDYSNRANGKIDIVKIPCLFWLFYFYSNMQSQCIFTRMLKHYSTRTKNFHFSDYMFIYKLAILRHSEVYNLPVCIHALVVST